MDNQRVEKAIFLFLFCLVLVVAGWLLFSKPSAQTQVEEVEPDLLNSVVIVEPAAKPASPSAAEIAKIAEQKAVKEAAAKAAAEKVRLQRQLARKINIPVYASRVDGTKAFTSFNGRADLVIVESQSEWSRVLSAKGFPVWISASLVDKIGNSHVRVKSDNVNLRSLPKVPGSRVLGRARAGDIMKINRKQGEWLRVWSPLRITAWVKSSAVVPQNTASSSVQAPK